jgi:hypothetical protein
VRVGFDRRKLAGEGFVVELLREREMSLAARDAASVGGGVSAPTEDEKLLLQLMMQLDKLGADVCCCSRISN